LEKYNQEAQRGYDVAFSFGIEEFKHKKYPMIEALLVDGDALMCEVKKEK